MHGQVCIRFVEPVTTSGNDLFDLRDVFVIVLMGILDYFLIEMTVTNFQRPTGVYSYDAVPALHKGLAPIQVSKLLRGDLLLEGLGKGDGITKIHVEGDRCTHNAQRICNVRGKLFEVLMGKGEIHIVLAGFSDHFFQKQFSFFHFNFLPK